MHFIFLLPVLLEIEFEFVVAAAVVCGDEGEVGREGEGDSGDCHFVIRQICRIGLAKSRHWRRLIPDQLLSVTVSPCVGSLSSTSMSEYHAGVGGLQQVSFPSDEN